MSGVGSKMRAVIQDRYGAPRDVLRMAEVAIPEPAADEVLVKVVAASVNPADWHFVRGEPLVARIQMGLRGPKKTVPGADFAGIVEAVGAEVAHVAAGDEVYGESFQTRMGTFAEYATVKAAGLATKPSSLTMAEAAAVPLAGVTALQAIVDHGQAMAGQRVLVVGASGGVGHFAVQIATALGAEVTGVCSTRNADFVRSLGAARAIDYTCESFLEGAEYDLVVQLAGLDDAMAYRPVMANDATLLMLTGDGEGRWLGPIGRIVKSQLRAPFVSQRFAVFTAKPNRADLDRLTEMIETGQLRPTIERSYPLAEAAAAIARVEQAHTRGKIAVEVE